MKHLSNPPRHRPVSVFLVEDSADDAFFFRREVSKSGLECEVTHLWDGQAAVDLLRNSQGCDARGTLPDVMFLDLKMPRLNGFEVLRWMRESPLQKRIEVIVLSGSDDREDRSKARALGAADYIVKPIRADTLTLILGGFIDGSQAEAQ